MSNYVAYYASQDEPGTDSAWTVYREEYPSLDADGPIDGLTVVASAGHPDEDSAAFKAMVLQQGLAEVHVIVLARDNRAIWSGVCQPFEAERKAAVAAVNGGNCNLLSGADLAAWLVDKAV